MSNDMITADKTSIIKINENSKLKSVVNAPPRFFGKNLVNLSTFQNFNEEKDQKLGLFPPKIRSNKVIYVIPQHTIQTTKFRQFYVTNDGNLTIIQENGVNTAQLTIKFKDIDAIPNELYSIYNSRFPNQISLWQHHPKSFLLSINNEKWKELLDLYAKSKRRIKKDKRIVNVNALLFNRHLLKIKGMSHFLL